MTCREVPYPGRLPQRLHRHGDVDPGNLAAAGKKQNQISELPPAFIQALPRFRNFPRTVGYIIGFPFELSNHPPAILKFLMNEVCPDHASILHPYALAAPWTPHMLPRVDAPGLQSFMIPSMN